MSLFAYGLSSDIRDRYTGPADLVENGSEDFTKAAFWYAVAFPNWEGYRVEHDPTYTAYVAPVAGGGGVANPGLLLLLGIAGVVVVSAAFLFRKRKRSTLQPVELGPVTDEGPYVEYSPVPEETPSSEEVPPAEPAPPQDEGSLLLEEEDLD